MHTKVTETLSDDIIVMLTPSGAWFISGGENRLLTADELRTVIDRALMLLGDLDDN
jgi:hypothetical protein